MALSDRTPYQADMILAEDSHEAVKENLIKKVSEQANSMNRLMDPERAKLIDHVLTQLASDPSSGIRRALAKAIKRIATLSKSLVMMLAQDSDEEVAKAMVQSSPLLDEEDLDALIAEKRDPIISAVASREDVTDHTATQILESDYSPAVTHLLSNKTAQMSEQTLNIIAGQAAEHEEWQEVFVTREGLSLDVIKKLSLVISNSLIKVMLEHNYLDQDQAQDVLEIVQERISSGQLDEEVLGILAEPPEPYSSTYERAKDDFIKQLLTEENLLQKILVDGERAYIIGSVAVLSCIPYDMIIREVNAQNARGLMAITWKAALSPQFGVEFQKELAHIDNKKILYPNGDNFPMTESELDWQLELLFDQDMAEV